MTNLLARRVAPGVPVWTLYADRKDVGTMSNLPMERAWCITADYRGQLLQFRATTREAIMLALRCAVDALDHEEAILENDEYIEDEDGEFAAMRAAEHRAEIWAMRQDMQEPNW